MIASESLKMLFCSSALKCSRRHVCVYKRNKKTPCHKKIQLLALILLSLLCPLMSLIMLLAIPRYLAILPRCSIVKEGSHLYLFSVLALPSGASAVVCGYRNNSGCNYWPVVFRVRDTIYALCVRLGPDFLLLWGWRTWLLLWKTLTDQIKKHCFHIRKMSNILPWCVSLWFTQPLTLYRKMTIWRCWII